jgi:hypothetical protein
VTHIPSSSQNTAQNVGSLGTIFKIFCLSGLASVFPQLFVVLQIALTLPVTSASTERTFSKLKLIKTRLRLSMKEDRLESLVIISCERDIEINVDDVIDDFDHLSTILQKMLL